MVGWWPCGTARAQKFGAAVIPFGIAEQLHVHVIRELSWTGMEMHAAMTHINNPQGRERIQDAANRIDATIRYIRDVVFGLDADVRVSDDPHLDKSGSGRP